MSWWIINRSGRVDWAASKEERPVDARPSGGDPFAPWGKTEDHVHVEDGRICGLHFKGSLWDGRGVLEDILRYEFLLTGLPLDEDVSLEKLYVRIDEFEGSR